MADLPGGIAGLAATIAQFHARGVRAGEVPVLSQWAFAYPHLVN